MLILSNYPIIKIDHSEFLILYFHFKVLFRVGLVLIKFTLTKRVRKGCPSMYETLEALKNPPASVTEEDFLVEQVSWISGFW